LGEREDHFDLGSGWPLAKDEPSANRGVRAFIDRAMSQPVNPIASYIVLGAVIGGLILLWCWWMSLPQRVDDPIDLSPSPMQIEFAAIANAEIKRREGWSGKVILAASESGKWYVWVAREPVKQVDKREIRLISIDAATRKVLKYEMREENDLPDSAN
jgi:hypothetical protein